MKTALQRHINDQQDIACLLSGIIDGLIHLHDGDLSPGAQRALMGVALEMADRLNANLDSTALPEGGAA